MKKLLLFVSLTAMALSFNSCSDDDSKKTDNPTTEELGGTLTMKVDGVQKNFNNVVIDQDVYDNGAVELTVTASENGNTAEFITFSLYKEELGADATYNWSYTKNNVKFETNWRYNDVQPQISAIVQTNSGNKLKGSFSGSIGRYTYNENSQEPEFELFQITEGSFDATYEPAGTN